MFKKKQKARKLMIVGAVPDEKHKMRYGGATVLMKNFLDYLDASGIKYGFVQTNKFSNLRTGKKRIFLNKIYFIWKFMLLFPWYSTIMFNFSDSGVTGVFPVLNRVCKLAGKKVVLRKFGGSFDLFLCKLSKKQQQRTLNALRKVDLILFETKSGINYLKSILSPGPQIEWFPNNRKGGKYRKNINEYCNRLVFISQISDEKGVNDILSVAPQLLPEYDIHLYGYIGEDKYRNFDWSKYGVKYHGEIQSTEVSAVLSSSCLLLLPSYYREGYPGIIIEAFSVGLPVIVSNVGGIPEMMTDGVEGMMISPGNVVDLIKAIKSVNASNYSTFCHNAHRRFESEFESDKVNTRIYKLICSV